VAVTVEATTAGPARNPLLARAAHRLRAVVAAVIAGVLGVAPHVLHHVGPLAGAALFAGAGGTVLFGAIGFVLVIPTLRKIHRHTGGWRTPAAALAAMTSIFLFSTLVIGPAISGSDDTDEPTRSAPGGTPTTPDTDTSHESHH